MEANLPMLRIKLLCLEYSEAAETGANYRRTVPDPRWNFRAADTSIFGLHLEFAGAKTFQNGKSGMDAINWMPEVGSVYIESEDTPGFASMLQFQKKGERRVMVLSGTAPWSSAVCPQWCGQAVSDSIIETPSSSLRVFSEKSVMGNIKEPSLFRLTVCQEACSQLSEYLKNGRHLEMVKVSYSFVLYNKYIMLILNWL